MTRSSTPRRGRRSAGSVVRWPRCGPTTWPPPRSPRCWPRRRRWTRRRSGTWSGAAPTRPARTTATSGRMAVLLAGLPVSVPAVTVNRLCGSSLDAAMQASRTIESGDADVVLAGGVESMTRAPWVLPKPSRAFPAGNVTAVSTTLGWRLVNERMPAEWTVSLGEANELLADRFSISPGAAGRVRRPLAQPRRRGVGGGLLRRPRGAGAGRRSRPGTRASGRARRAEKLAGLKPSFRPDGTITAGQRLAAQRRRLGAAARARRRAGSLIGGWTRWPGSPAAARHALAPQDFGYAPVEAAEKALARAGITWADVAAVELNEAFAVQSLACVDALEGRPGDRQRQGRRDRDRPPARRLRRPDPRHPRRTGSASPATGGAWPRSASASARRWPSSGERVVTRDGVLRRRRRRRSPTSRTARPC